MNRRRTDVEIRISRGSHGWSVSLRDTRSGAHIVRLNMSDADLGKTLGGQATEVEGVDVHMSPNLGKYMETQRARIPMPESESFNRYDPERWKSIVLSWASGGPLEGWQPDIDQTWNSHRFVDGTYQVIFRRWVEQIKEESRHG